MRASTGPRQTAKRTKLRLLILGVGSPAAQSVIDALAARRAWCTVIGTTDVADSAGNFRCDTVYLAPAPGCGDADMTRIRQVIRDESPDLVIPGTDNDAIALAELRERMQRTRPAVLAGSVSARRVFRSTIETARFARRHGLPFAPTAENAREAIALAAAHGLPLIGKAEAADLRPRVVILRSNAEIVCAFESRRGLVAQPFLDPPENLDALSAPFETGWPLIVTLPEYRQHTAHVVVGPDGGSSVSFGSVSTHNAGQIVRRGRCGDKALLDIGTRYAQAAAEEGWRGPLSVHLKPLPDIGLLPFEVEPGFSAATAALGLLGFDAIGEVVRRFLPGTDFPALQDPETDIVENYLRSYPVVREGVAALRTRGTWCRAAAATPRRTRPSTPRSKLRLLILSVGSLAAQNVIHGLGRRRDRCVLIGANSVADSAGNFRCDRTYLVPPAAAGESYLARVAALIREEAPDLVIPTRDDDVLALAMLAVRPERTSSVLLTGAVAAARFMNDKLETARFARRHGLPFAATVQDEADALELAQTHGLPLIGKPRSGNASRGVLILRSTDEIRHAFAAHPGLIAQPLLDRPADLDALLVSCDAGVPFFFSYPVTLHSLLVIVGPDGVASEPCGSLGTQVAGRGTRQTRKDDPELLDLGRRYARAAAQEGWRGPLNVQLMRDAQGRLAAFELNGRFGGGTGARAVMGFDELGDVIRRFLPAADFPALEDHGADVAQRYLRSYAVPRASVAALRAAGRWTVE